MYFTCLFCNAPFEKNESLEAFPVGRRLAFDEAKGRLWVVCKKCERWSLSPLDERWEAIEQAERLFRDTRKRVTTDNIGLAKVAEGTTLIRIGAPQRPEFAAWRYGDQFGRRRRRQLVLSGAGVAAVGAFAVGDAAAGGGISALYMLGRALQAAVQGHPKTVVAKFRGPNSEVRCVLRRHLSGVLLSRQDNGAIELGFPYQKQHRTFGNLWERIRDGDKDRFEILEGADAKRMATKLLPHMNRFGGKARDVADAAEAIETSGGPEKLIDAMSTRDHRVGEKGRFLGWVERGDLGRRLAGLRAPLRLALEMSLHEDSERRALEGELAELERAWRDAEEIAAIADNLTLPDSVNTALDNLKKR